MNRLVANESEYHVCRIELTVRQWIITYPQNELTQFSLTVSNTKSLIMINLENGGS